MVPVCPPPAETRNFPMTNQGLSIFDDEPEDGDTTEPGAKGDVEATQVIPVVQNAPEPQPEQTQRRPVIPPAAPPVAPPSQPTSGGTPTFPVTKRNGYDRAAVDAKVRQLSSEKAGLSASLTDSEQRVLQLEAELGQARDELSEQESPSYAGLGGRALSMLRLAEEEADEIRSSRHRGRADPRPGHRRCQGDPRGGRPRGGGHPGGAAGGARRAPQPADQGRRAGEDSGPERGRRRGRGREAGGGPACGSPASRRPTACAPRRPATWSRPGPPPTVR